MKTAPVFDSVIAVGPNHLSISLKTIRSLLLFSRARKIFIFSSSTTLDNLKSQLESSSRLEYVDENVVIEGFSLSSLRDFFIQKKSSPLRAGWYYQQFLKMAASKLPRVADFYLIWDSDTVMLTEIDFFSSSGAVLVNPAKEHHPPYFECMNKLLNLSKKVPCSFIAEHFMVSKKIMGNMIDLIQLKSPESQLWPLHIMNNVNLDDLPRSGFSEFETYGNFLTEYYLESYSFRPLKSSRGGTIRFGFGVNSSVLFKLMTLSFDYITFEQWHKPSKKFQKNRAYASFLMMISRCRKKQRFLIQKAQKIAG